MADASLFGHAERLPVHGHERHEFFTAYPPLRDSTRADLSPDGVIKRRLYRVNRMVPGCGREHAALVHSSAVSLHSIRPADNELYDRGCDLVEAAAAIRQLAADPRAARAVPAVLGCLEAALEELSGACVEMAETTERAGDTSTADAVAQRMRRGFANLELALLDARGAAMAARSLAARSLGS